MVFSSVIFLYFFLPITLLGYFVLPGQRLRNLWLLLLSLIFYAWGEPKLIVMLLGSMIINYGTGVWLGLIGKAGYRKSILWLGIAANLSLLCFYKYAGFILWNYNVLSRWLGLPQLQPIAVLLPLGISFYCFQGISYLVDVYRGDARAARNPLHVMLYIAMFPHQLAGPIVRFRDIAAQIVSREVTLEAFRNGIMRFTRGLAKKVLLANVVGAAAEGVFSQPASELSCAVAWLGVICYTLQIYLDFSAYSDMAIGLAAMFGITFAENFNHPYISQSVTEFWRRWHMTLSNWFRDYVYIPLGGNRHGKFRTFLNLTIVFLLCGLWHGADWTFIVWGAYHGLFLVLERCGVSSLLNRSWGAVRHAYTLLVVMVGWVFFKADTIGQALGFLRAMVGLGKPAGNEYPMSLYFDLGLGLVMAVAILVCIPWRLPRLGAIREALETLHPARMALAGMGRTAVVAAVLLVCTIRIVGGTHNPFIYFRF
jgi:alginate O-acetyltransferase complex protein AlgI